MSVVEATVVKASRKLKRAEIPPPEKFERYPRLRNVILDALKPNGETDPEKYRPGSFISDAARHAGLSPALLNSWIKHGEDYPNGPLGKFTAEVYKLIAERNDMRQAAIWDLAHKSRRWEAIARLGEQDDPSTWTRPKEGEGGNTTNIIDKLMIVHNGSSALTTGD